MRTEETSACESRRPRTLWSAGADPVLLVVKKNRSILANVTQWATTLTQVEDPVTGRKVVRDVPLLVIDDEADNASVDTAEATGTSRSTRTASPDEEVRPSTINGQIRALLAAFEKKAYVGYTATPFANILSRSNDRTRRTSATVSFPRSFIINLLPPSNYMGPVQVFGLGRDPDGATAQEPLPVIRSVKDNEDWLPTRHKKSAEVDGTPCHRSLRRCALSCSQPRRARREVSGRRTTRCSSTSPASPPCRGRSSEVVKEEVDQLRRRLRYGDGDAGSAWAELERPVAARLRADDVGRWPPGAELAWDDVRKHVLEPITATIGSRRSTARRRDVLDYVENAGTGLTVIAVGGDKLVARPHARGPHVSATSCARPGCTTRSCRWAAGLATDLATTTYAASIRPRSSFAGTHR